MIGVFFVFSFYNMSVGWAGVPSWSGVRHRAYPHQPMYCSENWQVNHRNDGAQRWPSKGTIVR